MFGIKYLKTASLLLISAVLLFAVFSKNRGYNDSLEFTVSIEEMADSLKLTRDYMLAMEVDSAVINFFWDERNTLYVNSAIVGSIAINGTFMFKDYDIQKGNIELTGDTKRFIDLILYLRKHKINSAFKWNHTEYVFFDYTHGEDREFESIRRIFLQNLRTNLNQF